MVLETTRPSLAEALTGEEQPELNIFVFEAIK